MQLESSDEELAAEEEEAARQAQQEQAAFLRNEDFEFSDSEEEEDADGEETFEVIFEYFHLVIILFRPFLSFLLNTPADVGGCTQGVRTQDEEAEEGQSAHRWHH
jgi:hypothetical protein